MSRNSRQRQSSMVGTSGEAEPPPARSMINARKLDALHKHVDKLFAEAESEQIDGRAFYGRIVVECTFQGGVAQFIKASYLADDRVA